MFGARKLLSGHAWAPAVAFVTKYLIRCIHIVHTRVPPPNLKQLPTVTVSTQSPIECVGGSINWVDAKPRLPITTFIHEFVFDSVWVLFRTARCKKK